MPQSRPPWWMYVIAASFLAYAGLTNYSLYLGVEGLGLRAEFSDQGMVVTYVFPRSPADRLGLHRGDRVVAVDGQAIYDWYDWQAIAANREVGRPVRLEIERGTERREVTLTLQRIKLTWSPGEAGTLALQVSRLFTLLVACVIAFSRPREPVARTGALTVAILGVFDPALPPGFAAAWRALPSLLGSLLWLPQLSLSVLGPIGLTFFASFPRRLFRVRWLWVLVWAPAIFLMLPWSAYYTFHQVYQPNRVTGLLPHWLLSTSFVLQVGYAGVGAAVLAMNYRQLQDTNERRRLRVVFAGFLVGVFPQLPFLIALAVPSAAGLRSVILTLPYYILRTFLFLAFPLSFAYAILRHRLFDIRLMIRRGLQYALARRVVLSLVPAVAAVLVLDLLLHGNQPLMGVLRARGWVYGALGGAALAAQSRRRYWLEALDRRFFRERYDAQRLLCEVVEEVHAAGSIERVAPHVVAKIEAALHSEFVALWIRLPGEASYHSLASAPAGHAPPALSAESKLITLVRVLGKPLELPHTESGWLQQQLPHEETDFLRQARIELLVPVALSPERTEALLALGPKRSEEPHTREDQGLLVAIAESLARLLERPTAAPARVSEAFEECPQCGTCYDTGAARCGQEGATLVPVRVPRQLAGRYRMERRLGRGGMGTVYAASDIALERPVAVKLIRDDLLASTDAAERFRREARTLAGFTHPNVVTVFDFGLAGDTRAFLVMELLEGTTVRQELQCQGRLAAPRTVEVLRGVCAAVEAAHRRQLIHRDLKPENIFLVRGETPELAKVLDFGIAKFLPSSTQAPTETGTGLLVGTLAYMAPEQLRGEPPSLLWDLWALAIIAYEMLTGTHPFATANPADFHLAVLAGRFKPVDEHLPDASARWQELFARAFAREPAHRPDSARAFLVELEHALR